MKPHYFSQDKPDPDDLALEMCIRQGWVSSKCLLGGGLVLAFMNESKDPCKGCAGPREKCKGRPEK